ncbi:MAG: SAM-dependent methyltransferase, partial [Chloroflexi bacterium]|nr:SAM-dependent methyltransferase [Chloroflexota bacterium]
PTWKFLTTGCNLNRDLTATIRNAGFREVEMRSFDLSVGLPVTIPNIVGVARV